MTGTWSLRIGPEVHGGLTLMRLERLVRSGTIEGHHLVCSDGKWMRVDEVPYLRRQIDLRKTLMAAVVKPAPRRRAPLQVGNVIHLFPELSLARLESGDVDRKHRRLRIIGRTISVLALLVLIVEAWFLFRSAWPHGH